MQYFTKSDNNTNISVHLESVSPSGNYFVGWHTKSRSIIHLYRKLSQMDDAVYGESINYTSHGDDVGTSFSGVVWYEEYGFVKFIFHNWSSFESESVRFYFDCDLYERKKKELHIPCVIICDTAHRIEHENAKTIVVEKGVDSVDFRLVNLIQKGDIAITQDYGFAAMCLSKRAIVLNQDGKEYTNENISGLLEFRAVSKKIRQSGGRLKGMPKRTGEQDRAFESALQNLLNQFQKSGIMEV